MELKEFLEKYLPDDSLNRDKIRDSWGNVNEYILLKMNFPEAFDNFLKEYTDKICAKQRKNCYTIMEDNYENRHMIDFRSVLNAEQPKLEDVL